MPLLALMRMHSGENYQWKSWGKASNHLGSIHIKEYTMERMCE
jgi:hypothetical protein